MYEHMEIPYKITMWRLEIRVFSVTAAAPERREDWFDSRCSTKKKISKNNLLRKNKSVIKDVIND